MLAHPIGYNILKKSHFEASEIQPGPSRPDAQYFRSDARHSLGFGGKQVRMLDLTEALS